MTWVSLCSFENANWHTKSAAQWFPVDTTQTSNTVLRDGSMVFEVAPVDFIADAIVLFNFRSEDQRFRMGARLTSDLTLTFRHEFDGQKKHCTVTLPEKALRSGFRVVYHWSEGLQIGGLSVECIASGQIDMFDFDAPLPVHRRNLEDMTRLRHLAKAHPKLLFYSFSNEVEPVSLGSAIAAPARVLTPSGYCPIEDLKIGQLVLTEDLGPLPIRWIGVRNIPAAGQFRPLRLRAPYHDLNGRDLLIAPRQNLFLEESMLEYLFGVEEALVEARHLVNEQSILKETRLRMVRYYQILLDEHAILNVGGARLESSLHTKDVPIKGPPASAPIHASTRYPKLRSHEAHTLRAMRRNMAL
ncbi:Hint domain-containing protein [Cochlodiniinecator piscidefendens]|uniref:Hint domain-containing protein n=1 Tax=Cochlodiniinecator piscidefendens TaxID=2715756 RepID=UPI001409D689|nr:Hint domain-containing protein [Cochlodiniinecator piscidefendens]